MNNDLRCLFKRVINVATESEFIEEKSHIHTIDEFVDDAK